MTDKGKGVSSTPWETIKTEFCSGASMRSLSRKYHLSVSTISTRAKKDSWKSAKEQIAIKSEQKFVETISDSYAELGRIYMDSVLMLSKKINAGIALTEDSDFVAHKQYMSCLKDLKEIGVFRTDLDKEEQRARIAKLRKEVEEDTADKSIIVEFKGDIDKYSN